MLTDNDILDALRACYDPEIPLDVVALGLVEGMTLKVDEEAPGAGIAGVPARQRLWLMLLPTTADEVAQGLLRAQIENRLAGLPELSRVSVEMLTRPVWTPARITPEGRQTLGLDRAVFPILNNRVR